MDTTISLRYSAEVESPVHTQKNSKCTRLAVSLKIKVTLVVTILFLWCGSSRTASV